MKYCEDIHTVPTFKAGRGWNGLHMRKECLRGYVTCKEVCSPIQWCGVIHEMMQFVGCVLAVFLCVCLSNTCSQPVVNLQLVGNGVIDGKTHY